MEALSKSVETLTLAINRVNSGRVNSGLGEETESGFTAPTSLKQVHLEPDASGSVPVFLTVRDRLEVSSSSLSLQGSVSE